MLDKYNPLIYPSNIETLFRTVETEFYILLKEKKFSEAVEKWEGVYNKILEAQNDFKSRFHKGGPLHNMGISYLFKKDLENAFKYFTLAYSEDVAIEIEDFGGKAKEAPAALTLKLSFRVNEEFFRQVGNIVIQKLKFGDFYDPRKTFKQFLTQQLSESIIKAIIQELQEETSQSIWKLPGNFYKRVFVGGNYDKQIYHRLLKIKEFVKQKECTPILASEFKDENEIDTARKSFILLIGCKYAIFEVALDSGHIAELQVADQFHIKTLMVFENIPGEKPKFTSMIKKLFDGPKPYSNSQELEKSIEDHLTH